MVTNLTPATVQNLVARKIYVGNLPPKTQNQEALVYFNSEMARQGAALAHGSPVSFEF